MTSKRAMAADSKPGSASQATSEGSGFQSGSQWRKSSPGERLKAMDTGATWRQYAHSMVEFVLVFGCVGFAFATAMRSSHHQSAHKEEIESLNYELAEMEEQLDRVQANWKHILASLDTEALLRRSSEPSVTLSRLREITEAQLFSTEPIPTSERRQEAKTTTWPTSPSTAASSVTRIPATSTPRVYFF